MSVKDQTTAHEQLPEILHVDAHAAVAGEVDACGKIRDLVLKPGFICKVDACGENKCRGVSMRGRKRLQGGVTCSAQQLNGVLGVAARAEWAQGGGLTFGRGWRAHIALQAERKVKLPRARRVGGEVAVVVGKRDADLNDAQHVDIHLQTLIPAERNRHDSGPK